MSKHHTTEKTPNPQGKGLVPVLAHWQAAQPRGADAKSPAALLLDLFASSLVLSSRFEFCPVVGNCYYLYFRDNEWRMSLITPQEWGDRAPGDCLGECRLRSDMTWQITVDPEFASNPLLQSAVSRLATAFVESLDSDDALAGQLPGYRRDLPYYRRLLATGLGKSLRQSLTASGATTVSARHWLKAALPALSQEFLTHSVTSGEDMRSQDQHTESS